MAITSASTVETEWVSKRDAIINYPPATLDDDLAKLEVLADSVNDAVTVLRAREEINNRPANAEAILQIQTNADAMARASGDIRTAAAAIQAAFVAFTP